MQWRLSAIKRNELSSHEKTWINLKYTLLSGRSQCEKAKYYVTLIIGHSGKGKPIETVKISVVGKGWG